MADVGTVLFNHFPDIAAQIEKDIAQAVKTAAKNVRTAAANNAPVDTGFLRDAIYYTTIDETSYGAGGGSPTKTAYLLKRVPPTDSFTAFVAAGANYSIYVELGTRHAPAQPFLVPALEAERAPFESALSSIASRMGR